MPFTPFHFGPHACIALALNKKIDIPVFIFANVAIDIEPLMVILFRLNYPLHGYAHTYIGAAFIGVVWGFIAFKLNFALNRFMNFCKIPYETSLKKCLLSGFLGACLHVLLDSPLYADIKPFYPLSANPFYGIISHSIMYKICIILFIPAIILYILLAAKPQNQNKTTEKTE